MTTRYLKKIKNIWIKNDRDNEDKLIKQEGPICWLAFIVNNFILNNDVEFSQKDMDKYIEYLEWIWVKMEDWWWNATYSACLFTEYRNDVLKNKPIRAYYLNDITKNHDMLKFWKLLSKGIIFWYSRSSWSDFKKDRMDLILDKIDYEETKDRHAVNVGIWRNWLLREYWSYWKDNKYNILWITPESFAWLLNNEDIRKSVFLIRYL